MARIDNGINVSIRGERINTLQEREDGEIVQLTSYKENEAVSFWAILGLLVAGFFVGQFVATIAIFVFVIANGGGIEILNNPESLFDFVRSISAAYFSIALHPSFYIFSALVLHEKPCS